MAAKTSSAAKWRYNFKSYDRLYITVPDGRKAEIEDRAKETGAGNVNRYINRLVCSDFGVTETEWGYKEAGKRDERHPDD